MSYTFLLEQGEESSVECFSDIPASVLSRLNLIAAASSCNGNETESCPDSRSGMTCGHLTENLGGAALMSCVGDFHAKISVRQTLKEKGFLDPEVFCGTIKPDWFAKYDQVLCLWKTFPNFGQKEFIEFSGTWPRWGIMLGGECWEQTPPMGITSGKGFGYLPRPQKSDGQKWYVVKKESALKRSEEGRQLMLIHVVGLTAYADLSAWWANPPFWEAMMAWPIGWTDCTPLETDKIREWLRSHGDFLMHDPMF